MEFIGYAYDVKSFLEILSSIPKYATIVVQTNEPIGSTPEVYYDEARQEVILK